MKISFKVLLYTHKTYSDGTQAVVLQYVINRKPKRKIIAKCLPDDWDAIKMRVKPKVVNATKINHHIATEIAKAEKDLYDIKLGEKTVNDVFKPADVLTLDKCFDAELLRLEKEFKSGYYDKMLAIRKQISDLSIDVTLIDERWFAQMIYELGKLGNSGNTIKKKIKLIRGMILRYSSKGVTKAVKSVTVPTTKSLKQKLSADELAALVGLDLPPDSLLSATRDLFLLQVYLRGIRVGDLLQAYSHNFSDGRFVYSDDKTGKVHDIKLIPQAIAVVDRYKGKHKRLFPFFTWEANRKVSKWDNERERLKHKEVCTSVVNAQLKVLAVMAGIKKPLSSHIARHTYARMAIEKVTNPMDSMELLGHTSLAVHQGYLQDIKRTDKLDKMNDDIFS